jgi:two-component system sensor histidine kinase PilS (NtrC family)
VGDLGLVTGFIYLTGGAESPFSFLYLLTIIIGTILLVHRGGFLVAAGSWVMYAGMALLVRRGILPAWPEGVYEPGDMATVRLLYLLVAHLVSFFGVAYLAYYLAESLHRAGQELEMRQSDLLQLRAYTDNIIDSMNSGLLTTDGEGGITFANRAAAEIMDRPIASWCGAASWTSCSRTGRSCGASAPSWSGIAATGSRSTGRTTAAGTCSWDSPCRCSGIDRGSRSA